MAGTLSLSSSLLFAEALRAELVWGRRRREEKNLKTFLHGTFKVSAVIYSVLRQRAMVCCCVCVCVVVRVGVGVCVCVGLKEKEYWLVRPWFFFFSSGHSWLRCSCSKWESLRTAEIIFWLVISLFCYNNNNNTMWEQLTGATACKWECVSGGNGVIVAEVFKYCVLFLPLHAL